jgi:hypothetical protein
MMNKDDTAFPSSYWALEDRDGWDYKQERHEFSEGGLITPVSVILLFRQFLWHHEPSLEEKRKEEGVKRRPAVGRRVRTRQNNREKRFQYETR